jgi:hypothetical protein
MSRTLYHGSSVKVEKPQVKVAGFFKDFGYGFYCTELERQARRWAATKRPQHIVNVYHFEQQDNLRILQFPKMTDEWLDFVIGCRRGNEHTFDIVEGPMADDAIWDYVEDFMNGDITREAFWVLAKFKHPTHQIVFCTEQAIRCLTFISSYEL